MEFKDLRILIIDDTESLRLQFHAQLQILGIKNIEMANNGNLGWQMITDKLQQSSLYHLLILDRFMPEVDGMEIIRRCRSNPNLAQMKILMATVADEKEQIVKALMAGADSYIIKPVDAETLKKRIISLINRIS